MASVRARLRTLLHAPAGLIALTHRTTDGINIAVLGQDWHRGDCLLTTSLEHVGGLASVPYLQERLGVSVHVLDAGLGEADRVLSALEAALRTHPNARFLVTSHVAYATGARLPVPDMAQLCHAHGVRMAVDGAQSVGSVESYVDTLGADYLAFPAQKWLFGPEGLGGLFIAPDVFSDTFPPMAGGASFAEEDAPALGFRFHPDARRFEVGTSMHHASMDSFDAALRWLDEDVGYPWLLSRIGEVAQHLREGLERLGPDFILQTPADQPSALIVVACARHRASELAVDAQRRKIVIRSVPGNAIRISASFFITDDDSQALFHWLRGL